MKELVNQELLIFPKYQMDAKNIKCPLEWWRKHEAMVPTIDFLAQQILGIIGFQIEIERVFSLVSILIKLRRYWL